MTDRLPCTHLRWFAASALTVVLAGCSTTGWQQQTKRALASVEKGPATAEQRLLAGELAFIVRGDLKLAESLLRGVLAGAATPPELKARAAVALVQVARLSGDTKLLAWAIERGLTFGDAVQVEALVSACRWVWGNVTTPGGIPKGLVTQVRSIAQRAGIKWEAARAAAQSELVVVARLSSRPGAVMDALMTAGVVTSWRLSAPWGQSPVHDASTELGPEKRPLRGVETVGHGWAKRPRRTWALTYSDGELAFPDMARGGVAFAESWVELEPSANDRRVVIRLESNRDVALYVNATQVLRLDAFRHRQGWHERVGVTLPKGATRLLVKMASLGNGGFARVRISPLDAALRVATDVGPSKRLPAGTVSTFEAPAGMNARQLVSVAAGDSGAFIQTLASLQRALERPFVDRDRAYQLWSRLARELPNFPGLSMLRARLLRNDPDLEAAQSLGGQRASLEKVLKQWPRNVPALRKLARIEIAQGRDDAAVEAVRKALSVGPRDVMTRLIELELYRNLGWESESVATAKILEGLEAATPRVLQEVFDIYRRYGRDRDATRTLTGLEGRFPLHAVTRRAVWLGERGRHGERARLLLEHWQRHPQRMSLARRAARALRSARDYAAAEHVLGKMLSVRPEDAWALQERAFLAIERGDVKGANRALDRALRLHPEAMSLETLRYFMRGQAPPLTEPEDIKARIAAYRARISQATPETSPSLATYPVVTLLDRTVVDVDSDGSTRELTHVVRVVQSKTGADRLGELRPPQDAQLLRVRTLTKDGRELWPDRVKGKPDLSFSGLQPGDVVEWAWLRRGQLRPNEGGYMTGLAFASWNAPTLRKEVELSIADLFRVNLNPNNGAPAPTIRRTKESSGRQILRWALDDLPAISREPAPVSARMFFPYTDVSVWPIGLSREAKRRADAWRAIARDYTGRIDTLVRPGRRMRSIAHLMRRKTRGGGAWDRVRAAFDFVKEELAHAETLNRFERSVEAAIAAQKGNRHLVLTALAKELGVDAEILLCAPEPHGASSDAMSPIPNANRFYYPVVRLRHLGKVTHADPSRPYNPFGVLPRALYGSRCLDLVQAAKADSTLATSFLGLPSYDAYEGALIGWTFDVRLEIAADGSAKGSLEGVGFGPIASGLRHVYVNADKRRREQLWQQWTASVVKGARVSNWTVTNELDANEPIAWSVAFEVPRFMVVDHEEYARRGLLTPTLAHYFASVPTLERLVQLPTRTTPLALTPHHEEVRIRVTFPQKTNWRVRTAMKDVQVQTDALFVSQAVTTSPRELVIERTVSVGPGNVAPEDYPAVRKNISSAVKHFSRGFTYGP